MSGDGGNALGGFGPATRAWFTDTFDAPTPVQSRGWAAISRGDNALLLAPTGSGKTLAAMLAGIDRATRLAEDAAAGVRVLYVSPLKALVHDVERNLRSPLVGILRAAERLEVGCRAVRADVRTGDTPQRDRVQQRKNPAEILVTTPESLFLILGSQARETLRTVETVIVDEVHAVAGTKRGTHLALTLERLAEVADRDPQRVGLSATVRPVDEVARFLGGDRAVEVIDAAAPPALDLRVVVPVPDMEDVRGPRADPVYRAGAPSGNIMAERYGAAAENAAVTPEPAERRVGVWPAVYPELVELVRAHRSTILFVNSRGLCERLATKLNDLAEEELVRAHHGSVSRDKRQEIEEALKKGDLAGIVATSSLELGIDMGAVDLVVLVESPGSVARGLQRIGRAGHGVGETSQGLIFPKFKGDLLECAALSRRMLTGELEPIHVPRNALDVLAQQVVALVCDSDRTVDEIEALVRRSHSYRELTRAALISVLEMLSGRFPSDDFADLRPRLAWDRKRDVLTARRGTQMILRMNAGTIPDRGLFHVHVGADGPRIGELDEEMVFESRSGDVILLGASSWRVVEITRDRVVVEPAPGEAGRLPFWRGDGLGRPVELGEAVGRLSAELVALAPEAMEPHLAKTTPLDSLAAKNLADYVSAQREHSGCVPTHAELVVERFRDELGDWRVCILSPFGARVHAPWALALQTMLSARAGFEVSAMYTDDGIVLTFADGEELPGAEALLPDPDELEDLVVEQLAGFALFGSGFRENAGRALLIPRRDPRRRTPLFLQRLKSKALLGAVQRFPDFPIVLETYRQCLRDVFDLPALERLLRGVRERSIRVTEVETRGASPFARSLVFSYVAAYLYEYDAPLAERRTQALSLDRNLLRELLGEAELRELLDVEVIERVERELQRTEPDRRARDADELHDLLRRLGALEPEAIAARVTEDPAPLLERLDDQRRAVRVRVAGRACWIAAEDAGLYRDGLGASPPPGLPDAFLAPVAGALNVLVARFARTHAPFRAAEVAAALGLREAQVQAELEALEDAGRVVRGAIDPRANGVDWCDDEVLRRIKRATLAKLRGEVAPVEAGALARFLSRWHGVAPTRGSGDEEEPRKRGVGALRDALAQLEGAALPWSEWVGSVLPARVGGFEPAMLDELCARGELVWIGRGSLGVSDGKVAFYRRETVGGLLSPTEVGATLLPALERDGEAAEGEERRSGQGSEDEAARVSERPLHDALVGHLATRGASFTTNLERAARDVDPSGGRREFESALWDLVWEGRVTNDTCQPLRGLGARKGKGRARESTRAGGMSRYGRRARAGDTLAGGRWSLVSELADEAVTPTERAHALAGALLDRHGIVARETAQAEELTGGFAAVYPVLRAMEESGRIRRGHFVEGLSGAQFALAGAVDRLRDVRDAPVDPEVLALAAVDPASPWGASLAWPESDAPEALRPRRVAGAAVVLVDGVPALYVAPSRRAVQTFRHPGGEEALLLALERLAGLRGGRRSLVIEKIDGEPALRSPKQALLERAGFVSDYRGFLPREVGFGA